jgi:hypothetical protein
MKMTVSKLVLELSLFDKKHTEYKLIQSITDIMQEDIDNTVMRPQSFFAGNTGISMPEKKMLNVVFNKLLKTAGGGLISKEKYAISISHAYFCFQNENEEIIFSSPHITSPYIFNPNDNNQTYCLAPHFKRIRLKDINTEPSVLKRNSANIIIHDEGLAEISVSSVDIVNSLFNYYKPGIRSALRKASSFTNIVSFYEPDRSEYGISAVSEFELKPFVYIKSKDY